MTEENDTEYDEANTAENFKTLMGSIDDLKSDGSTVGNKMRENNTECYHPDCDKQATRVLMLGRHGMISACFAHSAELKAKSKRYVCDDCLAPLKQDWKKTVVEGYSHSEDCKYSRT